KSVYNKSLYDGQFHTFGLAWTDSQYIFYIDGKETYRVGNSTVANVVCEVPLYLKLTVEFGSWAGTINKAKLPDAFVVDYVRVYKAV
ncbi:MAG: glycoside hydrolase family 16 protein, partial [Clostridia bacterium]|nr:glycoside hydrolase family 16 protein [Clostridia bacterium]